MFYNWKLKIFFSAYTIKKNRIDQIEPKKLYCEKKMIVVRIAQG